jgi:hypothetical protein
VIAAGGLLLASLKLPLWQMRMEAPQYRDEEALRIAVHPNALRGDLQELAVLNQYIGVHVPATLSQFKWLPEALIAGAILGLAAAFFPRRMRRRALVIVALALISALGVAAVQAGIQMHDIGHHRDSRKIMLGVKDFTPPFLGTRKIAQFEVSSRFGTGAWLIGGALFLQLAAAGLSPRQKSSAATNTRELKNPAGKAAGRLSSATV